MKRQHPEDDLAIAVAGFLRTAAPDLLWWHTPNEATLPKRKNAQGKTFSPEGVRRKKMGVRSGVWDIGILLPRMTFPELAFIELKVGKNHLTDAQKIFREDAEEVGVKKFAVCRSVHDVQVTLEDWGVQLKGRVAA